MAAFQFLILDYYFLGLTYIIVYVGAIAILFLFVIMLIKTDMVSVDTLQATPRLRPSLSSDSTASIRVTSPLSGSSTDAGRGINTPQFGMIDLMILDVDSSHSVP